MTLGAVLNSLLLSPLPWDLVLGLGVYGALELTNENGAPEEAPLHSQPSSKEHDQ